MNRKKIVEAIIIISFIGIIVFGLIFFIKGLNTPKPEVTDFYHYQTDTVIVKEVYHEPSISNNYHETPVKTYYTYLPDTSNRYHLVKVNDSLFNVVDSLNKVVQSIDYTYLTQFPKASKLIAGTFTKDSLTLDLLMTTGKVVRNYYPVNYSLFQYKYQNETLYHENSPSHPTNKDYPMVQGNIFGGLGYSNKGPYLNLALSANLKRFNFQTGANLFITSKPDYLLKAEANYRIK